MIPITTKYDILLRLSVFNALEEWGTESQIEADTAFWNLSQVWFDIEWEEHSYLLKATTKEAMVYAIKVIDKKIEESLNENS